MSARAALPAASRELVALTIRILEHRLGRRWMGGRHTRECGRFLSGRGRKVVQLTQECPDTVYTSSGRVTEYWRYPMPRHRTTHYLVCVQCCRAFERSIINGNKVPTYCSQACVQAAHPSTGPTLSATCEMCGRKYPTFLSRIKAGQKYCDRRCSAIGSANDRRRPAEERFWENVQKSDDPNACWLWTGPTSVHSYSLIWIGTKLDGSGRQIHASRFALELQLGRPIKAGMFACHKCDNPPCVRNDDDRSHLFEGTPRDNTRDMHAKGRGIGGAENPNTTTAEAQAEEIRDLAAAGVGYRILGAQFGIHPNVVSAIVRRERLR